MTQFVGDTPDAHTIEVFARQRDTARAERDALKAQNEALAGEVKALRATLAKEAEDAKAVLQQMEALKNAFVVTRRALSASMQLSEELRRMIP